MLPNACYRFTTQQWLLGSAVVAARDFGHNRAWLGLSATIGTFSSSRQRFRLTQACTSIRGDNGHPMSSDWSSIASTLLPKLLF